MEPPPPPHSTAATDSHDSQPLALSDSPIPLTPNLEIAVVKRKRGRPAKGLPKTTTPPLRPQKKEEEDVCFICFDGGSLVLCDRRGCPKAYHPACIKRDESFFHSKAKWNCGWHICSVCQKVSHYMCYTCTYSLCKGCTKDADFVSVRGNKGLCGICMRTIMLIEDTAQGKKVTCEVDFDDKSSWEYLFKVYWVCLKGNLSLTLDELLRAKNPWKGAAPNFKGETAHELYHLKEDMGSGSENSCIDVESNNLKNKKHKKRDKHRHIWDGILNDVGHSTPDLPAAREPIGNGCVLKNQITPNDASVSDSTDVRVVRSEASSVALDISSLLLSTGMEQPFNDFLNDKLWHYQDPTGKVQGPFSMLQLYRWSASGHFPPDLRIWRIDEKQDKSILLTDALNGKAPKNMSLPHNSQMLSLGASVALDNRDNNSQDCGENGTANKIHSDSRVTEQNVEQKVDDSCTQSNGKDESVRSNGWNSNSSSLTVPTNGITNEGQSGNFERKEESSKCEISCQDQPPLHASLPSTAFSEKLNENPLGHGVEGNSEDNGNHGSNRTSEGQSNSGQSYLKQSDSDENSGQSSGQNWGCPNVNNPVYTTSTWLAIFGEPTDCDESVSDLLAEVEAMESLGGLESATSIMKCGEELTDGSKNDCLSFADGLSRMLDAGGKGDALSSTGDLHLSQSTAAEEPLQQPEASHHYQRMSGVHPSKSSEVEVDVIDHIGGRSSYLQGYFRS